jgi:hypothetical protein
MAEKRSSSKKEKSTAKKKSKKKSLAQKEQPHDVAVAVVALADPVAEFQTPPTNSGQCILWRDGDVHRRIRAALSAWSNQPPNNITSNTTLGQLSVGTGVPWNEGNQGRLIQATNEQDVFFPFQSRMNPPPVLVPSSTTVAEWEKVVWTMQTPETFCFVFGS